MTALVNLTLAHSPDPDDVFMWWPITGKIDPRDHARTIEPPVLDTGRFRFRVLPADIDVLNWRAIEAGDLDITALSMFTWARVRDRYALTACGGSFGEGYGPKLVVRRDDAGAAASRPVIAIPGSRTTAFLVLTLALGAGTFDFVEMPFDRILDAVAAGRTPEGRPVTAGLLIHQSQLTFGDLGLVERLDLGRWWLERTGLPLPLGGNAVRRDLDERFGAGTLGEVVRLLNASIRHALAHRDEATRYAMGFAPEISRAQADRYIDMYVSGLTIDAGERGTAAVQRLMDEAAGAGLCPAVGAVEML